MRLLIVPLIIESCSKTEAIDKTYSSPEKRKKNNSSLSTVIFATQTAAPLGTTTFWTYRNLP
jgi:hypothetical protein